jgi:peptide chain release factor 1
VTRLRASLAHTTGTTLPALLLSASPTAGLGALMEIKAGVGGAEAALFADELVRMYERAAGARGWAPAVVGRAEMDNGGLREATIEVPGAGAYDALRAESGVHRVQRVPATETSGRTHTSTVAVVVCATI